MQKNPINEGDSIQEPMTLQDYEDAVSLPDGIYPITDDAGTVLDASVIAYGGGTVEDALNKIVVSTESITFNANGKYIYSGRRIIMSAIAREGNYSVVISNNGINTVLCLYSHEGTAWTRVTSQPTVPIDIMEYV